MMQKQYELQADAMRRDGKRTSLKTVSVFAPEKSAVQARADQIRQGTLLMRLMCETDAEQSAFSNLSKLE